MPDTQVTTGFAHPSDARWHARRAMRHQGHTIPNGQQFRQTTPPMRTGPRQPNPSWFLDCATCGSITQVTQHGTTWSYTTTQPCPHQEN